MQDGSKCNGGNWHGRGAVSFFKSFCLIKDQRRLRTTCIWRREVPGRGNGQCKGPEAGTCLVYSDQLGSPVTGGNDELGLGRTRAGSQLGATVETLAFSRSKMGAMEGSEQTGI